MAWELLSVPSSAKNDLVIVREAVAADSDKTFDYDTDWKSLSPYDDSPLCLCGFRIEFAADVTAGTRSFRYDLYASGDLVHAHNFGAVANCTANPDTVTIETANDWIQPLSAEVGTGVGAVVRESLPNNLVIGKGCQVRFLDYLAVSPAGDTMIVLLRMKKVR